MVQWAIFAFLDELEGETRFFDKKSMFFIKKPGFSKKHWHNKKTYAIIIQ